MIKLLLRIGQFIMKIKIKIPFEAKEYIDDILENSITENNEKN